MDQPVTVTRADQDRTVALPPGGLLEVRLAWMPGTGYDWRPGPVDPRLLAPEGEPGTEPAAVGRPGASETRIFRFRARGAGEAVLEFLSRRPWEPEDPPVDAFRVRIEVGG